MSLFFFNTLYRFTKTMRQVKLFTHDIDELVWSACGRFNNDLEEPHDYFTDLFSIQAITLDLNNY